MHLKYSKGSRQARQRCSALQGVEPNSLTISVSSERQRGQASGRVPRSTSRMFDTLLIRRHDAVLEQLAPAVGADPIAAPRRREHVGHLEIADAALPQRILHRAADHFRCRTTHIGRRQPHFERRRRRPPRRNESGPSRRCSRRGFQDPPRRRAAARPPPRAPRLAPASRGAARRRSHRLLKSRHSPARVRIGALQILHLGEDVAQMLAVLAALAMPGMRTIRGPLQGRLAQDRIDARAPRGMNLGQIAAPMPLSAISRSNSSSANSSTV